MMELTSRRLLRFLRPSFENSGATERPAGSPRPDLFQGLAYARFCARDDPADGALDGCFAQSSECSTTSVSPPEMTGC